MLAPNLNKSVEGHNFNVELRGGWRGVYSTEACIKPVKVPQEGSAYAAAAPFGGWLFRHQYSIEIPRQPIANVEVFKKPLSTTKAVSIPLDTEDSTFRYSLKLDGHKATCDTKTRTILCDVHKLKLAQGKMYQAELIRSFENESSVLAKSKVSTLPAVTLKQSSVQPNGVVYDKPREFVLEMDKSLENVSGTLERIDGEKREKIAATISSDGPIIRTIVPEDLPRNTQFQLTIDKADGQDGSGLEGALQLAFRTSGGPLVSAVSASGQSVSPNATVVLTFDQGISQTQDIGKLVRVNGVSTEMSRTTNQLHIKLMQAPKCSDVVITIDKGFASNYDVPTAEQWKHAFRTTCYTTSTIGTSSRGRAIQAHHFGNGGEAILFVGGIHGNEQSSSLILQDLIKDLDARARSIPPGRQIVVVPTLNPDGYVAGSRNNARNVNLNRNFATSDWQKDLQDTNGSVPGGGGETPMSEPETRAIAALSSQLRPRFVLSYHAVGSVVIGNLAGDSTAKAAGYAGAVGYKNGTGRDAEIFDYAISGTYDDWLAQKLGVPSMIVELGSYTYRNYSHHKQAMWNVITN
jgi:predicted deacylase